MAPLAHAVCLIYCNAILLSQAQAADVLVSSERRWRLADQQAGRRV